MTDKPEQTPGDSPPGKHRYTLSLVWDKTLPRMVFITMSPSFFDNPTVKACRVFAEREGCGGLEVVNLYAYVATSHKDLKAQDEAVAVGPDNDRVLAKTFRKAKREGWKVVCAWGAAGAYGSLKRLAVVDRLSKAAGVPLWCLGLISRKRPRHPLYAPPDAPLVSFTISHGRLPSGGFAYMVEARVAAGLSLDKLAAASGLHKTQILRMEHGRGKPKEAWLPPLAGVLGLDPATFNAEVDKYFCGTR